MSRGAFLKWLALNGNQAVGQFINLFSNLLKFTLPVTEACGEGSQCKTHLKLNLLIIMLLVQYVPFLDTYIYAAFIGGELFLISP